MTIKLIMMAALYCVIVLGPRLFAYAEAGAAGRR
jgi:hypothetical protein